MRAIAPFLLSALLAGCAATPGVATIGGAEIDPARVVDWSASGRMAIAVADQGGSGRFDWTQRAATTDLEVRGPLGAGALRIVTDGVALAVTDGEGESVNADAAREQVRARLGADLPLAEMRYWLLGLPAPGTDALISAATSGATRAIEQSGWTVTYEAFANVQGWAVPTRLTVDGAGARIKVIVDDWRLPEAPGRPGGAAVP
jgi:outer membrane lipoprotein LolB